MKPLYFVLATVAATLSITAADAAPLLFNFTGAVDASFVLDSDPVVDQEGFSAFFLTYVDVTLNGVTNSEHFLDFYVDHNRTAYGFRDGGLTIGEGPDDNYDYVMNLFGPVLFSGSPDAPHFDAGIFQLSTVQNGPSDTTLTIGPAPGGVPEPASWSMMLGGFGILGGALRNRRRTAVSFG